VASAKPGIDVAPRIGASSMELGRKPVHTASIAISSIAGKARRRAPSSSANRPPARNGVVEAALLDGRADDQPAVALGGHVDLLRPHDVSERSGIGRRANRKCLPLEADAPAP